MVAYLVYVPGLRGPAPHKWPELLLDMSNKVLPHLVRYELSAEEYALPLGELVKKYPPPVER